MIRECRSWLAPLLVSLILVLLVASVTAPVAAEETVVFNTATLKYHCADCRYAKVCTSNCIRVPLSEAKRRGGVPCKVCGGAC